MKKTIIAVLAVAALWAFWHYYEVKGAAGREEKQAQAKRLFPGLDKDSITLVEASQAGKPALRLRKSGGEWALELPVAAKADKSQVDLLLSQAQAIEREEVIDEKPAPGSLAQYGLQPAAGSITFTNVSGKAQSLSVGSLNPMGQSAYCQVSGSPQVLLAQQYSVRGIMRTPDQVRDKAVWSLDAPKVVKIRSSFKDWACSLEKGKDGQWKVTLPGGKPVPALASKVSDVLAQLNNFQVRDFIAEPPKGLAQYGLAAAKERVEVWEEGSTGSKVLLHGRADKATASVDDFMVLGRPLVFTMEKYNFTTLQGLAKQLEDKSAFKLKPFDVAKVQVEAMGSTYTAEKKAGDWVRSAGTPLAKGASADMMGIISKAAQVQAQGAVPKPQGKPEGTLAFFDAKGALLERVEFFGLDAKTGTRIAWAASSGKASKLAEDILQAIPR
jgi:hypothetical protein